jgi:FAD/FMN-containing dehydrogenase
MLTFLGGISFTSPERGWACDSVVNFQVVLANGEIVNANATSRSDLFTALKGGQTNFGIVTRFDLKLYPGGALWGGRIAFAPEADTALVSAFTDFKNPDKFDPYAAGWVTFRYNGSTRQVTPITVLYYTRPELKPGALAQMTQVRPQVMNGMQIGSPAEFARNASRVVKSSSSR